MFLAVAEASSRPLRVFCSDNWVSPLPSIIFRNPIIYRLGSNSFIDRTLSSLFQISVGFLLLAIY